MATKLSDLRKKLLGSPGQAIIFTPQEVNDVIRALSRAGDLYRAVSPIVDRTRHTVFTNPVSAPNPDRSRAISKAITDFERTANMIES